MGCTAEAIDIFEASRKAGPGGVWYAPGSKCSTFRQNCEYNIDLISLCAEASNCGGVAVSGLEMAQNSQRLAWTTAEVDGKLKNIMAECYGVRYFCLTR